MENTIHDTQIQSLNTADFDSFIKTSYSIYVIDFWAPWCAPCKVMSPVFEQVSKNEDLKDFFKFAKINTDENQSLIELLGFRTIPSFIVIKFNADSQFSKENNIVEMLGGSQTGLDLVIKLDKIKANYIN